MNLANLKVLVGNSVLVAWFVFGLWAGITILNTFGRDIGSLFPAYLLVLVAILFLGRFLIERIINSFSFKDQSPVNSTGHYIHDHSHQPPFNKIADISSNAKEEVLDIFRNEPKLNTGTALAGLLVFTTVPVAGLETKPQINQTATNIGTRLIRDFEPSTSELAVKTDDTIVYSG